MFVVVTVFGVWLGWQLKIVRERHEAKNALVEIETVMFTKAETVSLGWTDLDDTYEVPFWRRWMGDTGMAYISLNHDTSLETFNRIHSVFPEAVVTVGPDAQSRLTDIDEVRPGDPPRQRNAEASTATR